MPVEMVTREGVPIARTGSYLLSTGPATFTEEDLVAAVAAYANDPAVHAPRIKIDGLAENFDQEAHGGEPAVGTATNLRVSANGQELLADMQIPKWLDEVADWAYPSRSIEGAQGVTTPTGQSHDLIITAVALLGVHVPGISTLPDLAALLANGPEATELVAGPEMILAATGWEGEPVRAGMDQDIVRRRFYDYITADEAELPDGVSMWDLWVVAIRFDDGGRPYLKTIDEASGRLYRVDFSISGNEVSFDGFTEVVEQDVPVAAGAPRPRTIAAWATRAESRPQSDMGDSMTAEQIRMVRDRLGLSEDQLPDDATDEQFAAALAESPQPQPEPTPEPVPDPAPGEPEPTPTDPNAERQPVAASGPRLPDGAVIIDEEELARLRAGAEAGLSLREQQEQQERDRTIAAAIEQGKFGRGRREHYERMWASDPEGTRHLLTASAADGGLAAGAVPIHEVGLEASADTASEGTGWFPHLSKQEA